MARIMRYLGVKFAQTVGVVLYAWCIGFTLSKWEEILDVVFRVVPLKTVASSVPQTPSNTYGPTHQDPHNLQPILFPDEFRVLIVEPGSDAEMVRCRIVNVTKSWRTSYDALSYTWGDETIRETILVDGLRRTVTKNLHSALIHLRDPVWPRVLWVDTLCINQDDSDERDEQVRRLGSIYSTARRVVVWLGEQTQEVQGAFSTIKEAASLIGWNSSPQSVSGNLSPVFNLLRRSWFQRTWIIQEAVLAQNPILVCGSETLEWKLLSKCCNSEEFQELLPDNDPEVTQALSAVDMITHGRHECHTKFTYTGKGKKRKKHEYTPDFKLMSTLYETRGFQCKDERDKVFGVLSMVTNVGPEDEMLRPNYRASVEEVLKTVAQWDLVKNESLELLSYCSRKAWTHPGLPSWVPDFSDMDEACPISSLRRPKTTQSKAQRKPNRGFRSGHHPFFYDEKDRTVLVLSGELVDTIARVGTVTDNPKMVVYPYTQSKKADNDSAKLVPAAVLARRVWFHECVQIASTADPASRNELESMTRFWKSQTLGMSLYQFRHFRSAMSFSWARDQVSGGIRDYAKFLYQGVDFDPYWRQRWRTRRDHRGYNYRGCDGLDRCFRKLALGRRFCATQTGKLGWVPGAAKEGDLVCLVSGAQVPIILRRVPARVDCYMVVGDAYVEELMLNTGDDVYVGGDRLAIV